MLYTRIPEALAGRGIEQPQEARGFTISLDTAEPWGGGRIEGRVEARERRHGTKPVSIFVRCLASWLDAAPQLVGQKRFFHIDTYWDLRNRSVPIWLDDEVWLERWELGDLSESNWLHFALELPPELPRALEGTFAAFRWRVGAERERRVGKEIASLPLLIVEPQTVPVVRVETSPLGSWRLLAWRSEDDRAGAAGPCSISYDERRPEDLPLPGESPEAERLRRLRG
jgi:hypothetical protein